MKILTIVGNGFDLGHHLPTSFDDFIQSKVFIGRFFNEVAASAKERETEVFDLLDAKNKDALASRINTIDSLTNNAMFFIITKLCTEHERRAFEEGIRWGVQLASELV